MMGGLSNMLQVTTHEEHPRLGTGLLMRLSLREQPMAKRRRFGASTPLSASDLNQMEWEGACDAQVLGSWCASPSAGRPPVHVSFFPSALADSVGLMNLVMSEGVRARWAASLFAS